VLAVPVVVTVVDPTIMSGKLVTAKLLTGNTNISVKITIEIILKQLFVIKI
jgi:hypothetical protein